MLLLNPPNPPGAVSNKDTMGGLGQLYGPGVTTSLPPLDLLAAAGLLRARGMEVEVVECLGRKLETAGLIGLLADRPPELLALRTSTPTFDWDLKVARAIKLAVHPRIVLFGPQVTLFPEAALAPEWVDAAVVGEPEQTLLEIAESGGFAGVPGVRHKQGGQLVRNPEREPLDDLDVLPFPAWDLAPYRAYDGGDLMRRLAPFVTASTSRGCPHGCGYCPYPVAQGRRYRTFSPARVADELTWLARELGARAVLFRDPEFALRRERVAEICALIVERDLGLCWRCETRIENLDPELIALMAKAGCIGVNLGVESADPEVLRSLNRKPFPLERARAIVRACRRRGIETFAFFILGLPGETRAGCLRTIAYARKLNPAFVQFTVATPYPGTALRRWAEEKGYLESEDASRLTGYEPAMRNENLSVQDLRELKWLANEAWQLRPAALAQRLPASARPLLAEAKRWLVYRRRRRLK